MIEIDENTSIYKYASDRHTPELGFLVMWMFLVFFTGMGCSIITVLSWAHGILLGFGRNAYVITYNLTCSLLNNLTVFCGYSS